MIKWNKSEHGITSSDGKYSITARGWLGGGNLNWIIYDHTDNTYQDGFRYQRDAKAFAETLLADSLVSRDIELRGKKVRQSYYQTLLKRLTKS
jgi:hypothetical protein